MACLTCPWVQMSKGSFPVRHTGMLQNFRASFSTDHLMTVVRLSSAFANTAPGATSIAVGHDTRSVSQLAAVAITCALREMGQDTISLGNVTTPVASNFSRAMALPCVHVTSSHSALDTLGLKLMRTGIPVSAEEEIELLQQLEGHGRQGATGKEPPAFPHDITAADPPGNIAAWQAYGDNLRGEVSIDPEVIVEIRYPWSAYFSRILPGIQLAQRDSTDVAREGRPTHGGRRILRLDEDADQLVCWQDATRVPGWKLLLDWVLASGDRDVVVSFDTPAAVVQRLTDAGHAVTTCHTGDQFVVSALRAGRLAVGGEPNGHLINMRWLPVPDGLFAGLFLSWNRIIDNWASPPRVTRFAVRLHDDLSRAAVEHELAEIGYSFRGDSWEYVEKLGSGRCLVRFSAFEPSVIIQLENIQMGNKLLPATLTAHSWDLLDPSG